MAAPFGASAGIEHNLSGWAWSSTVGWMSFNCTNDNRCDSYVPGIGAHGPVPYVYDEDENWRISLTEYSQAIADYNAKIIGESEFNLVTSLYNYRSGTTRTGEYYSVTNGANYGVNLDGSNNLVGYAWSSNIGWIQFGGLAGFPTGGGTQAQNANLNGVNLKGWAKALAADGNGWDGWISLSGSQYSVDKSGTNFVGYAWGGGAITGNAIGQIVGWLNFDIASSLFGPGLGVNTAGGGNPDGGASLDVQDGGISLVSPVPNNAVPYGTIPTFIWTITPSPTCSVSKDPSSTGATPFTTISGITASGQSTPGNPLTAGTYIFKIECVNPVISKSVNFTVLSQPAGFSLGPQDTIKIQFLDAGSADSEQKNVFVYPFGGYTSNVTVSIDTFPVPPNASTTFSYSLGGSAFSANPAPVVISSQNNYAAGTTLKVRISKKITTPPDYVIRLKGVGAGAPTSYKDIIITPTTLSPSFIEF